MARLLMRKGFNSNHNLLLYTREATKSYGKEYFHVLCVATQLMVRISAVYVSSMFMRYVAIHFPAPSRGTVNKGYVWSA